MQLQQTSLLQTKTNYLTKTIYPYPCYLTSMSYHCHNRKCRTISWKFFSANFLLIPCTIMKKLGHIESLSLCLPIEPPLHAIHPPSFTWRLVSTLNQWEQKGKKQKEQKFSTHVYTYGTAKRVSMSALRRVLYVDWEFGYDFWQKSLPAWNWLKVLITAFTMARVRYLWQNCPCKEVTMQEYHTYLVPNPPLYHF